jgi:hypothetical protein
MRDQVGHESVEILQGVYSDLDNREEAALEIESFAWPSGRTKEAVA